MDLFWQFINSISASFFGWQSRLAVFYLCLTVVIVYVLWLKRGKKGSFASFVFPKETYLHKSNLVDIKVFLFNTLLAVLGLFAMVSMIPAMTVLSLEAMMEISGRARVAPDTPVTWATSALATVIMILTLDFCKYWAHRLHHETAVLWPFHALHHSAEIMTPLTATRNHPMFLVLRSLIYTVIVGFVQALMLFSLMGEVDVLTIGSVNAGYFIFNALGANLRHSHVWLSYGPVLEHVFISPAQHHIHHSIDRKHYNKNYGEIFAFWDLMFGTLYVPRSYEKITYGLSDENSERIEQPYPTLRAALLHPFGDAWRALWKGTSRDPSRAADAQQKTVT